MSERDWLTHLDEVVFSLRTLWERSEVAVFIGYAHDLTRAFPFYRCGRPLVVDLFGILEDLGVVLVVEPIEDA